MEPLATMPAHFSAGSTLCVAFSTPDHLAADGWTAAFALGGESRQSVAAEAYEDGWKVTLSAALAAALVPGPYGWALRGTLAGVGDAEDEVVDLVSGRVLVTADLSSGTADLRSWAEKALAAVETMLLGVLPDDMQTLQIGDRSIGSFSRAELLKVRQELLVEVARERSPNHIARQIHLGFRRR